MRWLKHIGFYDLGTPVFVRLLGMAYGSLLVGYCFGFVDCRHGIYPRNTVWVGMVSNGGAFLLLLIGAIESTWSEWGWMARIIMWISLAVTASICTGLTVFGPLSGSLK
jgi:hypothetical protein